MKSININDLIKREQRSIKSEDHHAPSINTNIVEIRNCFLKLFKEDSNALVSTNISFEDQGVKFVMHISKVEFVLVEEKEFRKRTYRFDFAKKLLTVNKRRAEQSDFEKVGRRIKLYSAHLLKVESDEFIKKIPEKKRLENSCESLAVMIKKYMPNLNLSVYEKLHNLKDKVNKNIASYLLVFGNMFKKKRRVEEETVHEDYEGELIEKLQQLMIKFNEVEISNKTRVNIDLNTVYSLVVNKVGATLIESNERLRNEISVDFEDKKFKLNGDKMTRDSIRWFAEKCRKIGVDLKNNKARMVELKQAT